MINILLNSRPKKPRNITYYRELKNQKMAINRGWLFEQTKSSTTKSSEEAYDLDHIKKSTQKKSTTH